MPQKMSLLVGQQLRKNSGSLSKMDFEKKLIMFWTAMQILLLRLGRFYYSNSCHL